MNRQKEYSEAMERPFLRIKDIGFGEGPCSVFEDDDICGKPAEWISSLGVQRRKEHLGCKECCPECHPEHWEPLRYCKRHWQHEIARLAEYDQKEAFEREHGYPAGLSFLSLIHAVGIYAFYEKRVSIYESPPLTEFAGTMTERAKDWIHAWVEEHADERELIEEEIERLASWVDQPDPSVSWIRDHFPVDLDSAQYLQMLCNCLRIGLEAAREALADLSE